MGKAFYDTTIPTPSLYLFLTPLLANLFPPQILKPVMAEALVSVLIEQLASIIHQQVVQQVKLVVNVEKEVANLRDNFRAIAAVLKDAEERQLKQASVKVWLDDLKDVSSEMEDVLDDWNTEILKLQIEKQENEAGNAVDMTKKKVCLCIPAAFFSSSHVSRVINRHDIATKIKNLNERLATIANRRQAYNFQYTTNVTMHVEWQKTTSFVDETFGRVDEKELLVGKLLSEDNLEGNCPIVIPIVGMGGIGKTTLAQLAFNDDRVKAKFTKRIWVCVSEPFDELNIAKDIIGKLDGSVNSISNDLEAFVQSLHKSIERKKILLVLDDVWNQEYEKWENLMKPLRNCAIGSKIIVTTRKEEVVRIVGASNHTINLKLLSDENCWLLFARIAFTNRNQDELKPLEPVGREIVKKSKGLPLVAKTLGGLMRYKKTKKEWQDVLSNRIWELDVVEKQVFQPLLLSYYDLIPVIKRCLLYCVIFPKDHIIDKKSLIELWMSQGYICSIRNKEKTMMDIGESYFDNLVMRSFIQNLKEDEIGNIEVCQMHDTVHDFLQFLTERDCFILEAQGENKIQLPIGNKFRHLSITSAPRDPFPVSLNHSENLRTLATFNCAFESLNPEFISQLKCVRTLNLSNNRLKQLPSEVGGLVRLRYLDLSYNNWKKLPDSLCNLINLETLRLEGCFDLEELPEAMGKLTNLRHLHVKECLKLKLPKSIAKLTSLQTLDQVNIHSTDGFFKVSDLRNMDQIQGKLRISWWPGEPDAFKSDNAEQAKLVNKKHLVSLELWFWNTKGDSLKQEETLNALQPNPDLEYLKIEYYSGASLCPKWMNTSSLNNLRCLTFEECGGCEFVPVLGKLASLEILRFRYMYKVKKVGFEYSREQVTLFPNLKHLEFYVLREWEEWEGMAAGLSEDSLAARIKVMPCLSTLTIYDCRKLKTLPDFLRRTPLQNLSINYSPILSRSLENRGGTEWANISHVPNIQIDESFVQKDGVRIQQEEEEEED